MMLRWIRRVRMAASSVPRRYRWAVLLGLPSFVVSLIYLRCGPLPAGLLTPDDQRSTVVVDRHGERLYEARSSRGTRGDDLDAAHLPSTIIAATMAAEDVRFRHHLGIDP